VETALSRRRFLLGACLGFGAILSLAACGGSAAAPKASGIADIAAYTGSDRQKVLEEGAAKEGSVSWYTTLGPPALDAIPKAFQAKYPNVKVNVYRSTPEDITTRILQETQARQYLFDVVEAGDSSLLPLSAEGVFQPFYSPLLDTFPTDSKWAAAEGKTVKAVITRMSISGFGYNTRALPREAVPAGYQDLLKPELKGKMAWPGSDLPPRMIGNLLEHYGEGFVRQLGAQQMKVYAGSATVVKELIGKGEVPSSPGTYRNQIADLKANGSPVEWVPLEPVTPSPGGPAVSKFAQHPHAAMLFVDFLLSSDVGDMLKQAGYDTPAGGASLKVWYPITGATTMDEYSKKYESWSKLFKELFNS
jgi:iron(III) transport system substrate-binding protein